MSEDDYSEPDIMSEDEYSEPDFTFVWKIKDFSLWHKLNRDSIASPIFTADVLFRSEWELSLKRSANNYFDCVARRVDQEGPSNVDLSCTISIANLKNSLGNCRMTEKASIERHKQFLFPQFFQLNLLFEQRSDLLPNDELNIRCEFEKSTIRPYPNFCSGFTGIRMERVSFLWEVHQDVEVENMESVSTLARDFSKRAPDLKLTLISGRQTTKNGRVLDIQIQPTHYNGDRGYYDSNFYTMSCKLTFLDADNKNGQSKKGFYSFLSNDKKIWTFPYPINVSDLEPRFKNPLRLHFTFEFSEGNMISEIEETVYIPRICYYEAAAPSQALWVDFLHMLSAGTFSDVTLKVGESTFQAHKAVLSARSPVLMEMLKNPVDHAVSNELVIADMEPETMHQFLLFLYTDMPLEFMKSHLVLTHEELWNSTVKLYSVAEKYEVTWLKCMCSQFLARHLTIDNVLKILHIGNDHKDDHIKNTAQSYFNAHAREILNTISFNDLLKRL